MTSSNNGNSVENAKEISTGVALYFGAQFALTALSVFALSLVF